MILQKDFNLYRLKNFKPDSAHQEKYQYQLMHCKSLITSRYCDTEFFKGKVTLINGWFELDLIASASEITDLESDNVFVIDVEIIK